MTVNAALVRLVYRPFPLLDGDSDLTLLTEQAKERLDQDDPGLTPYAYERCHALMIAHMYQMGDPQMGLRSFSSGDFSGSQDVGMTAQLAEYRETIETAAIVAQNALASSADLTEVRRVDSEMPELQLDAQEVPRFL
jgi:hypothetical protein